MNLDISFLVRFIGSRDSMFNSKQEALLHCISIEDTMDVKILYAIRGWIAFVAFMDFGTAVRSYIEKRSFLSKTIYNVDNFVDGISKVFLIFMPKQHLIFRGVYYL